MNALLALLIAAVVAVGLPLDASGLPGARIMVTLATAGVFVLLWQRTAPAHRPALLVCLILAGLGEALLSLGFGLYDYRGGGIPLFVPPGHVLLFALGTWLVDRAPADIAASVAWVALPASAVLAAGGADQLSMILLLLYLAAVRFGPAPKLYGVMFLLALLLELWGTWIGTWAWRHQVAGTPLHTLNPPLAAGAFYCVLDWLVQVLAPRLAILVPGARASGRVTPSPDAPCH